MTIVTNQTPYPQPNKPGTPLGAPLATGVTVPTVNVNANGLLELPYDQNFASGTLEAISGANDQLLGIKSEEDQQGLSYQKSLRDASGAYGTQQRTTRNTSAAGGTLFSSRYGTGVVNDATAYANQVGDIEGQNAAFKQDANLRKTAIQTALQNQLASLTQAYADKLGGEAGTLGYGQAKNTPTNTAAANSLKAARAAYKTYRNSWDKAQQLTAIAKRSGKPADKKRAAAARKQAETLRNRFNTLKQRAGDYKDG